MANVRIGEFQCVVGNHVNRDGLKFAKTDDSRPCTNPFRRAPL